MDMGQLEILSLLEKLDGITHDASSGEVLDEELVQKARVTEMEDTRRFQWRSAGGSRGKGRLGSSGSM